MTDSLTHHETSPRLLGRSKLCVQALIDVFPLALAMLPWGVLCGSLSIEMGLSAWQAQCMSLFVFAGAAQLSSLNLLGVMAPPAAIVSSTVVISSRHLLYSAVLRSDVAHLSLRWRCLLAFLLTDEMFALAVAFKQKYRYFSPLYALIVGLGIYSVWNIATLIGIVASQQWAGLSHLGLEFAVAAIFIAIVIPMIKSFPILVAVLISGVTAIICTQFSVENGLLIAAGLGMLAGYCCPPKEAR